MEEELYPRKVRTREEDHGDWNCGNSACSAMLCFLYHAKSSNWNVNPLTLTPQAPGSQ